MKIIGFVYHNGQCEMVLKGDSCMLNGRKPFFVPDDVQEAGMTPCIILRVSRLGKEIALRFAGRYYDAIARGADFAALDQWREAEAHGHSWTPAIAFDYSLALGVWNEQPDSFGDILTAEGLQWVLSPEQAIEKASKVMTIRQGDLIYIQAMQAPEKVQREQVIQVAIRGEEKLYCKIK